MCLHEDKFDLICHQHRPNETFGSGTYSTSTGIQLKPVNSLKDLGVVVSSDLSWSPQVNAVTSRARTVASWVLSVLKTRKKKASHDDLLQVFDLLIRSHLE